MIRLKIKKQTLLKRRKRLRNKARQRKKIFGTQERPRLVVFRSSRHIYAQLINDISGKVIAEAGTLKNKKRSLDCKLAGEVGSTVAKKALDKKVKKVVFDRNGFIYHGRVKALAEAARAGGLMF